MSRRVDERIRVLADLRRAFDETVRGLCAAAQRATSFSRLQQAPLFVKEARDPRRRLAGEDRVHRRAASCAAQSLDPMTTELIFRWQLT
jgi:hypothetical protein